MTASQILIVEDDVDIAENLKELLELEGYTVSIARDGSEALKKLRSGEATPQVILLDLMMPVMDGFQFRAEQMRDPEISDIPVVVMTAGGNTDERIRQMNFRGYFRKPLDINKLFEMVEKTVDRVDI